MKGGSRWRGALERWRYVLERTGMKDSQRKTCVNERHPHGTLRSQGLAVKKVEDFKHSGSTVQSDGESEKKMTRFSLRVKQMSRIRKLERE